MNVSATGMPVARTNSRSAARRSAADHAVAGQRDRIDARRGRGRPPCSSSRAWGSGVRGLAARQRLGVDLGRHHVLGQLDVRGAGLLGLGDLEGLAHDLGDDRRVGQPRVPLGDRAHHAQQVDVLVRLLVHPLEIALAGEGDERGAVEVGVGHGGDEVRARRGRGCRGTRRRGRSAARRRPPCRRRPARGGPGRSRSTSARATR